LYALIPALRPPIKTQCSRKEKEKKKRRVVQRRRIPYLNWFRRRGDEK